VKSIFTYGAVLLAIGLAGCGGGNSSSNTTPAEISGSTNTTPVADAGVDQDVFEGKTVSLSGSGTDSDGTIASYAWTQLSGTNVALSASNQASVTFDAPDVSNAEALEFSLTVTDNLGATASDTVIVNVAQSLPVEISSAPSLITKSPYGVFEFSVDNASELQCKLDDGSYEVCTSPYNAFPLDVGNHQVSIRAVNQDGIAGEPTVFNWTVSSIFGDSFDAALHADILPSNTQPAPVEPNSWRGILRINCDFSHSSYNDPVVFPGQADAAHLHRFYGNTLLDENSDIDSLFTTGESSCQGNELNRSAYWYPALLAPDYDQQTGNRVLDGNGDPAWKAVTAVVGDDDVAHELFYYSAGVDDLESIQPIPLGLKMIAGNHMGQPGMEQDTSIVRWHCQSWESSDATNPRWSTSIPECLAPDRLRMDVFFPSCWNGTDLDSSDHKSHLAYPINPSGAANSTVCPANHPVPIIRVSFHYAFGVKPDVYEPTTMSSRGWRLASDMYDASTATPGGMSLHADWVNAWHPEALQAVLDTCIKEALDCHDGNLGTSGARLSGTRPGTQFEPEVINKGLGMGTHTP
jgi:hypothetical protein